MSSVRHGPAVGDAADPNQRAAPRTALFVAAVIVIHGQANAVRIRNLSPSGALIEGPVLPRTGEAATLVRAHLRITGKAAWVDDDHCGFVFDQAADVAEWMARGPGLRSRGVDCSVGDPLPLATVIALLETVDARFAGDPEIANRHPEPIRALGRALDMLRGLVRPS